MEIFHFIDHEGRGTIHQLLYPLERWSNHHVYSLDSTSSIITLFESIQKNPCNRIVLHTTGGGGCSITKYIVGSERCLENVYIFLHTSLAYQYFKKRDSFIDQLKTLIDVNKVKVLTPSKACVNQLFNIGVSASSVQLGIPALPETCFEYNYMLAPYYGKILTTCASSNPDYVYIKGIDSFSEMVSSINQEQNSMIAGSEISQINIQSKNFTQPDFLNILCHSLAYVQLSRFESYNITAIQAKQLMIPVFLVDVEGTRECMLGYVFDGVGVKEHLIKQIECQVLTEDIIIKLYQDSLNRENIFCFKQSIEENVSYK